MARIIGDERDNELFGGREDDRIEGRGADDTLTGDGGDDRIDGGEGDDLIRLTPYTDGAANEVDTLIGGDGYDRIEVFVSFAPVDIAFSLDGEVIVDGEVRLIVTGFEGIAFSSFNGGDHRAVGTGASDSFFTDAGDDTLVGRAGDDRISGGTGHDRIDAGAGDDDVSVSDLGRDRVDLGAGDDGARVFLPVRPDARGVASFDGGAGYDAIEFIEGLADFDGSVIRIGDVAVAEVSNFEAIEIRGSRIQGLAGDDSIGGTPGDDRLHGRAGDDLIFAGSGDDQVAGGAGDDHVEINDFGRDRIDLGSGDDRLVVQPGVEPSGRATGAFDGGTGHDILEFNDGLGLDSISFDGSVISSDGTVLAQAANFEAVNLAGRRIVGLAGDDTIEGTDLADRLSGLDGDDGLFAGAGRDTLRGGAGDDDIRLILDGSRDVIDGGVGFDTFRNGVVDEAVVMSGRVDGDFTVTYGGRAAVVGSGFEALTAQGGVGDDRLFGGAAADVVNRTGLGGDVVRTFGGDDVVSVSIEGGRDRIDLGVGFDAAILRQDVGAPSLSENVVMSHNDGVLTVTAGGREAIRITGAERFLVEAGEGDDRLIGGGADDQLSADSGRNLLKGLGGDDALAIQLDGSRDLALGGAGFDVLTASADFSDELDGGLVTEVIGDGAFRILLGARVLLEATSVEAVDISGGRGADLLIGQGGADVLSAAVNIGGFGPSGGEDTLIGGAGDDTLIGGFDTARIEGGAGVDTADLSALSSSQGFKLALDSGETVRPSASGVDLARLVGVENIVGGKGDDWIIGDGGDNVIGGSEGADTLDGGDGIDTLSFASLEGFDVEVRLSDGLAYGQEEGGGPRIGGVIRGFEHVIGSQEEDTITGDAGDNRIAGGEGFDVLAGGQGADTFVFANEPFVGVFDPIDEFDRVRDFSSAEGDRLDLTALAAEAGSATPGALAFVGRNAFSGAGGEVRYEFRGNETRVLIDLDGDRGADQPIVLEGRVDLSESDFILG